MTQPTAPAGDRLFALIASIPGSGSADWCGPARALLDEVRAEAAAVSPPADRAACRTTRHCAHHGWCHRCAPAFAAVMSRVNAAIQRTDSEESHWGPLYEEIGKEIRAAALPTSVLAAPADRDRIAAAARTVPLRLGPNALAMAQRGEPIILSGGEADAIAGAVLAVLPVPDQQTADDLAATTCSAQYHGPGEDTARLCIRAAQHTGKAHTDEHGFHWSDTVAMYPLADGTFRTGVNLRAELRRLAGEAQQDPAGADRAALARVERLALAFEVSGNEFIAERIRAALNGEARQDPAQDGTAQVQCSAAAFARPHGPHRWEPQPGMTPVRCPGACSCDHPADEHSVYGCADGCACEYLPARKPMDPIHILGIDTAPNHCTGKPGYCAEHGVHRTARSGQPETDQETFCDFGVTDTPGSGCILLAGHEPANRHIVTPGDTDDD